MLIYTIFSLISFPLVFMSINYLGITTTTLIVIALLTTTYSIVYWRNAALGTGLAYFGLSYVGAGMLLLAIGLLQSHAGCRELIGDCYQPSLPPWLFELKTISYLFLVLTNSISVIFVMKNLRSIFSLQR
jgi:hypothetical protein